MEEWRERERSEDWVTSAEIKENKCVIVNLKKHLRKNRKIHFINM